MLNSAEKIEKMMELTISLNNDIADSEARVKELEEKLSILNTLKEVNYYMGAELELKNILQIIIDVVMGVLGVSVCSICLIKDGEWEVNEHSILSKGNGYVMNLETLKYIQDTLDERNGEIIIYDLSVSEFINLNVGSFIALPLLRGNNKFGIITIYYIHQGSLNDSKIEFFKLISAQLGIHLENGYLYEKVKLASISDGLTGLYNRLHMNEVLHRQGQLELNGYGIIMMDIDNFKRINDTYGHMFGDTVLKELALILKKVQKDYGVTAFRYGGEEFIILCNGLDLDHVCSIAEAIRIGFSGYDFYYDGNKINFTLSLGVALFGHSSKIGDVSVLIDTADSALYFSKKSGKNKYSISTGDLQLFQGALESINKMIARYKRFSKPFTLYKIEYTLSDSFSKSQYQDLTHKAIASFRVYDSVFYNNLGGFIGILEDVVEEDVIKKRFMANLGIESDEAIKINTAVYEGDISTICSTFNIPRELLDKFMQSQDSPIRI